MVPFRAFILASLFAVSGWPVLAQESAPQGNLFLQFFPFIIIIFIFYFLLIRPQQQRQKAHTAMIAALKKHDVIVTQAGFIGKITKVAENELTVELAEGVRVRLVRSMVMEVRTPQSANDA